MSTELTKVELTAENERLNFMLGLALEALSMISAPGARGKIAAAVSVAKAVASGGAQCGCVDCVRDRDAVVAAAAKAGDKESRDQDHYNRLRAMGGR